MISLFLRLKKATDALHSRWRNLVFRALGVRLEGYVWMRNIEIPRNGNAVCIGAGAALDHGVQLLATTDAPLDDEVQPRLRIGSGTYINRFTIIDAHRQLEIGENCILGPFCYLTDADHATEGTGPVRDNPMKAQFLKIEDGVWIGSHCVLLPGITIGKNAVIGAGSVVTKDVPAGAIAFGSPAKVKGQR